MSPAMEFAFFFTLGLVALTALVVLIVFAAACRWYWQDMRHLRARAREAAPALDDAIRLAVVDDLPAAVQSIEDWRRMRQLSHRNGAA